MPTKFIFFVIKAVVMSTICHIGKTRNKCKCQVMCFWYKRLIKRKKTKTKHTAEKQKQKMRQGIKGDME